MRTNPAQLPTYQELENILASEARREIPSQKRSEHYTDFTTIVHLLKAFDLPTHFFEADIALTDLKDPDFFSEISETFDALVRHILRAQDEPEKQRLFDDLYTYLSEEDAVKPADILFVFGSKSTYRIDKALALYQQGYAPKILISGKGPFYEQGSDTSSEAEKLADHARKQGVPEEALILETESITVPDNVKRSLNLLEAQAIPHRRIILVNSPFVQRRGWGHFMKFSAENTELIRSNTDTVSEKFSKTGWYRDETGARVITKEFFGLRVSTLLNTA